MVKRLKLGIFATSGAKIDPKIVRIGAENSINLNVRDVYIDDLVNKELQGTGGEDASKDFGRIASIRMEIEKLRKVRNEKITERTETKNNASLVASLDIEIREIKHKIADWSVKLDSEKDKQAQVSRTRDSARRQVRLRILTEAEVICTTLSGAGHEYMSSLPFDFPTVIIDEAAQSIEISSLIPLKYGCKQCIMVGGTQCFKFYRSIVC